MMFRFACRCWGVSWAVHWSEESLASQLTPVWLPNWRNDSSLGADWNFTIRSDEDGTSWLDGPDMLAEEPRPELFSRDALERRLHMLIACQTEEAAFVHAGVVLWKGALIVIPGLSFAGKSTLTHALVEAGAGYYSDEYAVIDQQGMVHPFPRALSLRQPGGERRLDAGQLGWRSDFAPGSLQLVLATSFATGGCWQPRPLSRGETVLQLMENTVSARLRPQLALQCLSAATAAARGWSGPRGEVEQVLTWLDGELA